MKNKRYGMQLDEASNDLKIENKSIVLGETLPQNEYLLLVGNRADFKTDPTLGVGINEMLNDNDLLSWKRKIREGLQADGMRVDTISMSRDGKITELKADYR